MINWNRYPNFSVNEFRCSHTGKDGMQPEFMDRLQKLRTAFGRPMFISSGYRHETHPIEARKATPGAHTFGRAADIAIEGGDARELVGLAIAHGFTGIGVNQKGASGRFIHLDDLEQAPGRPRPWLWSY